MCEGGGVVMDFFGWRRFRKPFVLVLLKLVKYSSQPAQNKGVGEGVIP